MRYTNHVLQLQEAYRILSNLTTRVRCNDHWVEKHALGSLRKFPRKSDGQQKRLALKAKEGTIDCDAKEEIPSSPEKEKECLPDVYEEFQFSSFVKKGSLFEVWEDSDRRLAAATDMLEKLDPSQWAEARFEQ